MLIKSSPMDKPNKIVKAFNKSHVGDTIAIFNEINRLLEDGCDVSIADTIDNLPRYQMFRDLFNMDWDMKLTGTIEGFNTRFRNFKKLYGVKPIPTKVRHNGSIKYNKITYTMDAVFMKEDKLDPSWLDVLGYNVPWICVEKPMTFVDKVEAIAKSDLYIGPDNGIAHLCRSIGTPMIILEYKWPLILGFPNTNEYTLCKTIEDIKKQIDLHIIKVEY